MSEKRRHSVDLPISKTLVAMRRVRSLRDPTTNSMSKFPAFTDHNWETNSCNGVHLAAEHGSQKPFGPRNRGRQERRGRDSERCNGPRKVTKSKLNSYKKADAVILEGDDLVSTRPIDKLVRARLSLDGAHEMTLLEEFNGIGGRTKELGLTWVSHSGNSLKEYADSCSEHNNLGLEVLERSEGKTRKRTEYFKPPKLLKVVDDGVRSCAGSPSLTVSDARMDASSVSTSIFADEETEFLGSSHRGCGISCCWSRTPKFRNSNQPIDVEENHPLLLAEAKEMNHSTCFRRDLALYSDYTRSLSDKFWPRSFDEVVGQDVVTQSLSSAISKGKVASLYLFHGPRGTGKTSTARIFAAAVNCVSTDREKPCGFCRQCVLFFSGRCRDAREVESAKMNRTSRIKALIKNAAIPPISSRFKVFIIDECQLLRGEIWNFFLNALDELSRHVIFVMITDDLDKLPRNSLSRCQKYHFPKIREVDIVTKLERICVEEKLEFDMAALEFVASKSNGSVRDAEAMLDQLGLLGKRITMPLVYELNGIVSDEELLELLDLALSSDTSNTVRRARELMRSRVDPMQLISQLANLIMDILAGRCQSGNSSDGRFLGRFNSEADLQKLRHALKVLSETEKQLKMSKSQTTWLTVALLQFSAGDSSLSDGSDSRTCFKTSCQKEDGFCSTLKVENFGCSALHLHNPCASQRSRIHDDTAGKLEMIWSRAVEKCQSKKLKKFLRKEGKLSSICVNQDLAIVEVDFGKQDHVSKAEKSWKVIASSLQLVLGCNVEIRINLIRSPTITKNTKLKKSSFSLLSCSHGMSEDLESVNVDRDHHSEGSRPSSAAAKVEVTDKTSSIDGKDLVAIRDTEGNTLSTVTNTSNCIVHIGLPEASELEFDTPVQKKGLNCTDNCHGIQELETQPSCFSKTFKLKRILSTSEAACTICLRIQPDKIEMCVPQKTSQETYFHKNDPFFLSSSSNTHMTSSNISADEDRSSRDPEIDAMMHCWKSPKLPAQSSKKQQRRSHFVGWVLPCSTAREFSEA